MINVEETNILRAVEVLFKIHFIFNVEYDSALSTFWQFIETYFYKINIVSQLNPLPIPYATTQLVYNNSFELVQNLLHVVLNQVATEANTNSPNLVLNVQNTLTNINSTLNSYNSVYKRKKIIDSKWFRYNKFV